MHLSELIFSLQLSKFQLFAVFIFKDRLFLVILLLDFMDLHVDMMKVSTIRRFKMSAIY